jgi:hypothetical protein
VLPQTLLIVVVQTVRAVVIDRAADTAKATPSALAGIAG